MKKKEYIKPVFIKTSYISNDIIAQDGVQYTQNPGAFTKEPKDWDPACVCTIICDPPSNCVSCGGN